MQGNIICIVNPLIYSFYYFIIYDYDHLLAGSLVLTASVRLSDK